MCVNVYTYIYIYIYITVKLIILKEENLDLDILRPNPDLLQKMQLLAIQLGIQPATSRM